MQRLQDYLLKNKLIKNDKWLDEYLRPAFKKAFVHVVNTAKQAFMKDSRFFEIFGLDFMLDSDLNLWFIESNASPVFEGTSKTKEIF